MVKTEISQTVVRIKKSNGFKPGRNAFLVRFNPLFNIITLPQIAQHKPIGKYAHEHIAALVQSIQMFGKFS